MLAPFSLTLLPKSFVSQRFKALTITFCQSTRCITQVAWVRFPLHDSRYLSTYRSQILYFSDILLVLNREVLVPDGLSFNSGFYAFSRISHKLS